ncbi:MarR family winged helix-turn-helix transcriptional regulator [Dongia sedimenti]|uniref:MarR family winged helix-turn-helix transcriptional regulator n=1 Tax=Dongia sedimenti TaxID=3064282 RepID=A0ABU0YUL1_9PROT|nr:MarR family winged helix-turn-helix transcriptional regulator [Rhodospirillaceae bacterium R-7]
MLDPMRMKHDPSEATVTAWARLVRAGQTVLGRIEAELKAADLPPLSWYDVLLELSRAENGRLRPLELERRTLLAQYNASRLIDRMEKAGLVERLPHPEDGRGQLVAITSDGRAAQKRIWKIYGPAIARHVGEKLRPTEAVELARLLQKLID